MGLQRVCVGIAPRAGPGGAFASYLAWMWMLARYPATKMSSFVFLTPVFALLFGAGWLGEPITAGLVAALGLVAVGIVLVNRKPRQPDLLKIQ